MIAVSWYHTFIGSGGFIDDKMYFINITWLTFTNHRFIVLHSAFDNHRDGWLQTAGMTMAHKVNTASMQRHLAEHSVGHTVVHDAPVHPLLCVAARALMAYARQMRGIVHPDDEVKL